jgi:hypothetical protein
MLENTPMPVEQVVSLLKSGHAAYSRLQSFEGRSDKQLVQLDNEWLLELFEPLAQITPDTKTLFYLDVDDSLILDPLGRGSFEGVAQDPLIEAENRQDPTN